MKKILYSFQKMTTPNRLFQKMKMMHSILIHGETIAWTTMTFLKIAESWVDLFTYSANHFIKPKIECFLIQNQKIQNKKHGLTLSFFFLIYYFGHFKIFLRTGNMNYFNLGLLFGMVLLWVVVLGFQYIVI